MKKECARIIAKSQKLEGEHQRRMGGLRREVDRLKGEAEGLRELLRESAKARGYPNDSNTSE